LACKPTPNFLSFTFFVMRENNLTAYVLNFFTKDTLSVISDVASVISLILTLFVLYDVRKLRERYKFRVRGPEILRKLKAHSAKLADYLNEFEGFLPQIDLELGRAHVQLKSLEKKKLPRPVKKAIKHVRKSIQGYNTGAKDEESLRRVYVEMMIVIEEVNDYQKDSDWER